jgi:hypothetical protein
MTPTTCDPRVPATPDPYFAQFTPATLALLCEATALEYKLGRLAGAEAGLIWAAVRSVRRGLASCPALAGLSLEAIEDCYRKLYRKLPSAVTPQWVEKSHGMNMLSVLPPRCRPTDRRLDFSRPVTPGVLLAEVAAKFDYRHGANAPLQQTGRDMRSLCAALAAPDGFVAGDALIERGTIPPARRALYERACEKAAFVGTWLVRDLHAAAAAEELGTLAELASDGAGLLRRWDEEVAFARDHVSRGGCVWLVSFPGPRPWAASACRLLGVGSVVADIFAAPPGHA